jgi:hypothetical protein
VTGVGLSRSPRVALVHYWLVAMRGGERVLERLLDMFPDADVFTHVYDPAKVSEKIRAANVRETFVGRLPGARRHYQKYLPLMPMALEELDLRPARPKGSSPGPMRCTSATAIRPCGTCGTTIRTTRPPQAGSAA